jgi:tetratricopeptide (TPR) repeat protein
MKRAERHHLKENPVAQVVWELRDATIGHSRAATLAVLVVLVAAAATGGSLYWRARVAARADALLASAMTVAETPVVPPVAGTAPNQPPTNRTFPSEKARMEAALAGYLEVVQTYPKSAASTTALYEAANVLAALGRTADAEERYREVMSREGQGIYGQMASMGLADAACAAGRFDQAIEVYKQLSAAADTRLPVDGILMQLGRAYAKAGKTDEAARTYTRIVEEFSQSPYVADARVALDSVIKR